MNSQVMREISPEGTSGLWRVGFMRLTLLSCRRLKFDELEKWKMPVNYVTSLGCVNYSTVRRSPTNHHTKKEKGGKCTACSLK